MTTFYENINAKPPLETSVYVENTQNSALDDEKHDAKDTLDDHDISKTAKHMYQKVDDKECCEMHDTEKSGISPYLEIPIKDEELSASPGQTFRLCSKFEWLW